jgi:glycosyltransferase involved in cell wall biosynthesis
MINPRISVGLPVYNGAKYLRPALEAMLSQDFEEFELIISDNASTDETEAICRVYAANDRRIQYHRNDINIGSARNYRRVFDLARGEFFKWCSHDDVCRPSFLRRCFEVFDSLPSSVVLVYPLCDLIDECGEVIGRARGSVGTRRARPYQRLADVLRNFSYAYPIWGLIRAECLRRSGLTGSVWYWDEVLLAELALYGEIVEISEVLSAQRCHRENALALCSVKQGSAIAGNPTKANRTTRRALRAWADPLSAGGRMWLPNQEEHYWEYVKRIHRSSLAWREKILCYQIIPIVCYWGRVKNLGGAWRRRLEQSANTPGWGRWGTKGRLNEGP